MSQNLPAGLFAHMRGWQTVLVSGSDAKDFMQRLTTANFKRLVPGQFTPATLLQPTGKIIVYFKSFCLEAGKYLLLVPPQDESHEPGQLVADALERMHFREDFTIVPLKQEWNYLRVVGQTAKPASIEPGFFEKKKDDEIWINENKWNVAGFSFDFGVLASASSLQSVVENLKTSGFQEVASLEPYRIQATDPASPNEINTGIMPLEIMLDDAVHENKGCYPGQEVIERIRAIGQPPRLLVGLRGQGVLPQSGSKINSSGKEVGLLTSATADPQNKNAWLGIGLVRRVSLTPESTFTIDDQSVTVQTKTKTEA